MMDLVIQIFCEWRRKEREKERKELGEKICTLLWRKRRTEKEKEENLRRRKM